MKKIVLIAASALILCSCSVTQVLREDQYLLQPNKVKIVGSKAVTPADVTPYIKQQPPGGLKLFQTRYGLVPDTSNFFTRIFSKLAVAPVLYDANSIPSSVNNINNHLEHLGYYGSEIKTEADTTGKKVRITYSVTPGKQFTIDEIRYHIPEDGIFPEEFAADSVNSLVKAGTILSETTLEKESTRGSSYFRNLGYYDFSPSRYSFEADTVNYGDRTILDYYIRNYSRNEAESAAKPLRKYTIGKVTISHPESIPFRQKVLLDMNTVKPGTLFSEKEINTTYTRLSYLKVFNSVRMELNPVDTNVVDCNIQLSESNPKGFKVQLEASSNSSGLLGISPQISFYHKNVFHGGEWLNLRFSGNFQRMISDPTIHSTEFTAGASLSFPRILGLPARRLRSAFIPRSEVSVTASFQDRYECVRTVFGLSYGHTGNIDQKFFYNIYPFQVNYVNVRDLDQAFIISIINNPYLLKNYDPHLDAGLQATLMYTTNSDIVPKTPYFSTRLDFNLSGNVLSLFNKYLPVDADTGERMVLGSPYSQYVKAELNVAKAFRWGAGDSQALAMRFNAGFGHPYGNSINVPFEQKFFVGGAGSMRGWQLRTLGPGDTPKEGIYAFSIPGQTAEIKVEVDLEYRFKMFWKLEGALFAEAGNIYSANSLNDAMHQAGITDYDDYWEVFHLKDFYKVLGADMGLGLRLNLDFILIRLDAGFKLHDPSLPEGSRWLRPEQWFSRDGCSIHFGVGYPF